MYSLFKSDIKFEEYLNILPKSLRFPLIHFRTSNHKFPIEVGRWGQNSVPHADRKCTLCTLNDVGDEMHYLLICPFFKFPRIKYLPSNFYTRPNVLKFSDILNVKSPDILRNTAIFVKLLVNHFKRN